MRAIAAEVNINQPTGIWGWVGLALLAFVLFYVAARGMAAGLESLSAILRKGVVGVAAVAALLALAAFTDDPNSASAGFDLNFFQDDSTSGVITPDTGDDLGGGVGAVTITEDLSHAELHDLGIEHSHGN